MIWKVWEHTTQKSFIHIQDWEKGIAVGITEEDRIDKGDFIHTKMNSGKTAALKVLSVKYHDDIRKGQFVALFEKTGYLGD